MMTLKPGRVVLRLPKRFYRRESLAAGALALGEEAQALLDERKDGFQVELRPARKASAAALRALAGRFLNEALSHEYRQKVIRFHRGLSQPALSRLLSKGFTATPEDPLEQLEPQVRADRQEEADKLLEEARQLAVSAKAGP